MFKNLNVVREFAESSNGNVLVLGRVQGKSSFNVRLVMFYLLIFG